MHWIGRITPYGGRKRTAGCRGRARRSTSMASRPMRFSILRRCTKLFASSCPTFAIWTVALISASRPLMPSSRCAKNLVFRNFYLFVFVFDRVKLVMYPCVLFQNVDYICVCVCNIYFSQFTYVCVI